MREVTLYRAVPERVLAGDYVEVVSASMGAGSLVSIRDSEPAEFLMTKSQLPVVELCDGHSREYVALDETLDRLVAADRERAQAAESDAFMLRRSERCLIQDVKAYSRALDEVEGASLWQRIKAVFCGTRILAKRPTNCVIGLR